DASAFATQVRAPRGVRLASPSAGCRQSGRTMREFRRPPSSPSPNWPDGKRLAVSIVVNVEEGAELSVSQGDERNESVYEVVEEVTGGPDLCMESHFEYGTRVGWDRIRDVLAARGIPATLNACARAVAL